MNWVIVDWTNIQNSDEFYDSVFMQTGAPSWHGRNLDAINDSWIVGSICEKGPPFGFVFLNEKTVCSALIELQGAIREISERSVEENEGEIVSVDDLKADILGRIQENFGEDYHLALLEIGRWKSEAEGAVVDRVLRAVVHLASGSLDELKRMIVVARQDFRDVLYWSEYDEFKIRLRDFNNPFGEEVIDCPEQR